ncbi:hypothetical protein DVH02_11570 [Streptomyces corynorhini]|uniref:Phage head morphogenesis domain-containing protein n=1 Tax=Streptomyces corynorhini TaxID=2282652 RepID=A0A370BET5_9ACTN|nr:hypothetical protein DVH02_11570 [Streptomyces corynorhini]
MSRVATLLAIRIRKAATQADLADIDAWWARVSPQIRQEIQLGQSATAFLTRRYLREHAALQGVDLSPVIVSLPSDQIDISLRVSGPVAFKDGMTQTGSEVAAARSMSRELEGTVARLTLAGGRQTTMQTFRARPAVMGWRRVIRGKGCPFCLMLRGRGVVYSKGTVNFRTHNHCRCTAELVYRRAAEPPDVRRLQQQWQEATAGTSGTEAIAAWRSYVRENNL